VPAGFEVESVVASPQLLHERVTAGDDRLAVPEPHPAANQANDTNERAGNEAN
jgi:hypothetical protein